jgi:ADP-ribose pyrophosphatase YjhB (NUDIX family)
MRTFPGCWVMPGGMLDPGESFQRAAAREVTEETGLQVEEGALRPVAAWESSYPTTPEHCEEAGGIVSHVLMVCFAAPLAGGTLQLQPDETDTAVWVRPEDLHDFLTSDGAASPAGPAGWLSCAAGGPPDGRVERARLAGVYPNGAGEGIGLGHSFALAALLRRP